MDIVEEIKKCKSEEELKALADEAIEVFTEQAKEENICTEYLGDRIGYNPRFIIGEEDAYESNNVWNGYIPKGTKVVYARFKDELVSQFTNNGYYYFMDDDSYVYDFFQFIKDEKDIEDDYDIIVTVHKFIEERFAKYVNPRNREIMHHLLYKDDTTFYAPVREHGFTDFYYNGSAKCTEMAIMGQNLLSLLNIEVIYVNDFNHAYNIYIPRGDSEDANNAYVIDFGNFVPCFDINLNYIGKIPFFGKIKDYTPEMFEEIFEGKKRITFPNYIIMRINNTTFEMACGEKRDYGVDYLPLEDKKLLVRERTKKNHNMDF